LTDPRHELGRRAEQATARWLADAGWQILERRWRTTHGELDLVAIDPGGVLVAIEVKGRRTARAGSATDAVDRRRLHRLRMALAAYAQVSARSWADLRVDLVTVEPVDGGWRLRRHAAIDAW
jgi:putative endonuclease